MHVCAEYGHETLFRYFLNDPHADPMVRNYVDETPLHLAAREGKFNIVTLLLTMLKVDVDADTVVTNRLKYIFRTDGLP